MEFLKSIQADIMMILSGVCGIIALFVHLSETMSRPRRIALMLLETAAMFLMIADRHAYMARGDISTTGWWMVRISNFLVFFLTLVTMYALNLYQIDLFTHEGKLEAVPKRLKAVKILALAGMALVVISQFTGLYYTFDEMNRYQRAPGFILCYAIPFVILLLQMSVAVQYRGRLSKNMGFSLLLFFGISIAASVLQLFVYGLSLNNISIAICAALLYVFALRDLNREVAHSRTLEIEHYKKERENEHILFEQTAEALATAIDAKDPYTHGHSARVAMYSTQIAREAGLSGEECEQVYFAALLHDVGKIGVPSAVINKPGRLTDEEFALIKQHPVTGNQILSSIQQSPYLSIGAHYHHERYDGRGYPTGLKGTDIPKIARIIGVADAYDAMTSKRSYRDPIPQQTVREEIMKGTGTQFDPEYAKIMIHLIDLDIEYTMREREAGTDNAIATRIKCEEIFHECTTGIPVTPKKTTIQFYSKPDEGLPEENCLPTLVLFDALDAKIHEDEAKKKDLLYFEYARIRLDGRVTTDGARKAETREKPMDPGTENSSGKVILLNGSMRNVDGNSAKLARTLSARLHSAAEIVDLKAFINDTDRLINILKEARAIVLCVPLYVDGLPARVIKLMEEMEKHSMSPKKIYLLANMGLYESRQLDNLFSAVKRWCGKTGHEYCGGLGISAGELMGTLMEAIPLNRGTTKKASKGMDMLARSIDSNEAMGDIYAEPFAFPRWLYILIANTNWNRTSRKNGIKPKDMFTKDI